MITPQEQEAVVQEVLRRIALRGFSGAGFPGGGSGGGITHREITRLIQRIESGEIVSEAGVPGDYMIFDAVENEFQGIQKEFNVLAFGAVGNGVVDDTVAIQDAIDAAPAGATIYFPTGTYRITSTINLNKKLVIRGTVTGDGGGVAVTSGSRITGTAITMVLMTETCVIEDLAIVESAAGGNAATIALDINDGVNSVANWILRNVYLSGTLSRLGTGLRCIFGLKGEVSGCVIEGWSIGVDQQATGLLKSNANAYVACKIRANATGLKNTDVDTAYIFGCTIEGNTVNGIEHLAGKLFVSGNHFENDFGANIKVSGGNLVSYGNGYFFTPPDLDIWISAGAGNHSSYGDTLNNGIKHDGTGPLTVYSPISGDPPVAGTGPIGRISSGGLSGLQGLTTTALVLAGYDHIQTSLPIVNPVGAGNIGGSGGGAFTDATVTPVFSVNAAGVGTTFGGLRLTRISPAYGVNVSIDAFLANEFDITVTDGVAFQIDNPTNPGDGQRITITVQNASGGAMGVITWDTLYKLAAWVNPADTFSRSIDFKYNGVNWVEVSRTPADVPN